MKQEMIQAFIDFLGCSCEQFPEMEDDTPIFEAYQKALEEGKTKGYVPVLLVVNENLLEMVRWNSGLEEEQENRDVVLAYRKEMLAANLPDVETFFKEKLTDRKEMYEEDDMDFAEIMGEVANGEVLNRFISYWSYESPCTNPMILAKIPVKNPWEVFAYVPFGGWNDCPNTEELMAVYKYWYEKYGAVPAVITSDQVECYVETPVGIENAEELALEQYLFCCDIVEQSGGDGTVGWLADGLAASSVWYFWWD